jgi:DHA1 family inner membrane transport protein
LSNAAPIASRIAPQPSPDQAPSGSLAALALANFAIGIGAFVVVGALSPLADGLGMSHAEAGMVMSVYAAAYAIASPLAVALTGRLDRRSVILAGMAVYLAAVVLSVFAPNTEVLLAARALSALGAGMVTPVAAAIAVAVSPPSRRGGALAAVFAGFPLAMLAGIPAGSFVGYTAGWRATFALVVAISAVALAGILWRVPRIRTPATTFSGLRYALASPTLMVAVLITASMMAAVWILFTYFAPLLEDRMGYGRNGVTLVLIVYGSGAVVGNLIGGTLTDRIGPPRALGMVAAVSVLVMPLFSFLPMPDLVVAVLAFTWGVAGWAFMVPQQSRLVAIAPESQNVSLALNASAIYVGAALGSTAGGAILAGLGFDALGWFGGLAALGVLAHIFVSIWLERRKAHVAESSAAE